MGLYDWAVPAFFEQKSFVVFDLETTGLEPKKDEIVEIGAIKFDRYGPIARFSILIDPGIPMPPAASQVNHITDDMLKGKPILEDVLPDFIRFIDKSILIAHNASFDCSFINEALAKFSQLAKKNSEYVNQPSLLDADPGPEQRGSNWVPPFPVMPNQVLDTIQYAKEAFPGRWKYNLQDLAQFLGIRSVDAHRAEDDARVCMELFLKCIDQIQHTPS